ncbi:hypothetical protein [Phyllobacterium sp. SB3]|uniref:hypothetical protein n=1 Tax=Phyllobacterium sp. SB3 TaxID=3156073 RepID=UPI0032B006EC
MTKLSLYTRSFHPDTNFGMGGLGFHGDSRGFSADKLVTARIYHILTIDLQAASVLAQCDSDPSSNEVIPRILEGREGRAAEILARNELTDWGVPTPPENPISKKMDILPPMKNDYSQKRKKPRHNESVNITPYRKDGDQAVNGRIAYAGKNFAFYGADSDIGHGILGGEISDGGSNTEGGSLKVWKRWGGVVPDLDVTHEFSIRFARSMKTAHITSAISGDGFPNCESFLIDSSNNVLFLASHIRIGTAATQLPGGRALPMSRTMIVADLNEGDIFGEKVNVQLAVDYTGDGSPQEIAGYGELSRADWNRAHTGRDASGNWLRQVEDNVPLPRQTWRSVKEQIRNAF